MKIILALLHQLISLALLTARRLLLKFLIYKLIHYHAIKLLADYSYSIIHHIILPPQHPPKL
jgi:hypothetical protein